jgi:hypothetical protein
MNAPGFPEMGLHTVLVYRAEDYIYSLSQIMPVWIRLLMPFIVKLMATALSYHSARFLN